MLREFESLPIRYQLWTNIFRTKNLQGCIPYVLYTLERVIGYIWVQSPSSLQKSNSHNKTYFDFLAHLVEHKIFNFSVIGSIPIKIILVFYYLSLDF